MGIDILNKKTMLILSIFILISAYYNTFSQAGGGVLKVEAKEFYFNFMPNFHNSSFNPDSLYIFITTEKPAQVKIEAYNNSGTIQTQNIQLNANSNVLKSYHYRYYELEGDYGYQSYTKKNSQIPVRCGFHITSDVDIYVYALTASDKSSDAMIIYPTFSLSNKYYVLSYNSDPYNGNITPSQFSIMATEDSTNINISPSTTTSRGNTKPFKVTLNKGQSYLVQDSIKRLSNGNVTDLSGTYIESDKNIAVFAGQQRATIPIVSSIYNNPSRDFLCEQLMPIDTWGKDAFITPMPKVVVDNSQYTDLFRIISSEDNNKIQIGKNTITLQKGQFYEGNITEPIAIYAERPIMAAQYKRTSRLYNGSMITENYSGDPLMIIVPPKEQFLNKSLVFNLNKGNDFTEQYLVIVAPDTATNKCYLDDRQVSDSKFQKIPNSDYSYAEIQYNAGLHKFECVALCGLYVYGYGYANSYGYTGGMRPNLLDINKPEITSINECYNHKISINDSIALSYGIKSIEFIDSLSYNVKLNIGNDYYKKYKYNAEIELIDINKDGYYTLKVTDMSKNISFKTDTVSGNTFSFINLATDGKIELKNISLYQQKCTKLIIRNSGIRTRIINNLPHTNNKIFTIPASQFPMTLLPGQEKEVLICAGNNNAETNINLDTFKLSGDCNEISAIISAEFDPFKTSIDTKCNQTVQLVISSRPTSLFVEDAQISDNGGIVSTNIGINVDGITEIKLYDASGKLVKTIFSGELKAGIYQSGFTTEGISSGLYFISVTNCGSSANSKLILTK